MLITSQNHFIAKPCVLEQEMTKSEIFGRKIPDDLSEYQIILYVGKQNMLLQNLTGFFIDKRLFWKNANGENVKEVDKSVKNCFLSKRYVSPMCKAFVLIFLGILSCKN